MLVRRRGAAGGRKITADRSERHSRNDIWVERNAAVVAHHIRQLLAELVALGQAGGHGVVWQHVVIILRFDRLHVAVDATGEMEILVRLREGVAVDARDAGGGPLKKRKVFEVRPKLPRNAGPPRLCHRRVSLVVVALLNPKIRRTGRTGRLARPTGRALFRAVGSIRVVDEGKT